VRVVGLRSSAPTPEQPVRVGTALHYSNITMRLLHTVYTTNTAPARCLAEGKLIPALQRVSEQTGLDKFNRRVEVCEASHDNVQPGGSKALGPVHGYGRVGCEVIDFRHSRLDQGCGKTTHAQQGHVKWHTAHKSKGAYDG
jgi:hypothetical protein